MIKKILIGIMGTPFTGIAIQRAIELAKLHSAKLTGVTVLDRERLDQVGKQYSEFFCSQHYG